MIRKVSQIIHTPSGDIVFDLECGHEINLTEEGERLGISGSVAVSAMRYECPYCQGDFERGGLGWHPKANTIQNALMAEGAQVIMEFRQRVKALEERIKEFEK